jgi:hypothetical protein
LQHRCLGDIGSDALSSVDFSVLKTTKLRDSVEQQFRAKFLNLTNAMRFAPPNAYFGSATFGQVRAQSNQPRVVQFALNVIY